MTLSKKMCDSMKNILIDKEICMFKTVKVDLDLLQECGQTRCKN